MKFIKGFLFFLFSGSAYAIDPGLIWQTISTSHFEIHFALGNESLAWKTADVAERVHTKLSPRLNWQPDAKTHLVISDETDQPNGYALPFPFNRSVLFLAPPDNANSLEDFSDWLELLITHEYTHILHLDKASGGARNLRDIFGRHFLLFPNMFQPGWFTEGLATHYETSSAQGIGRGQSSLFAMMMRMEVAQGIKPVSQVNLPIRSWPMGTSHYLYGVHFYEFLSEQYGDEAINALIANYSNNIIPFMINTNIRQLFDKDVTEIWEDFALWLQQKYQPQIQQILQQGVVAGNRITDTGYFTSGTSIAADGTVFYIRSGAFDHSKLMMIDAQGVHHALADVHDGARIDVNAQHDVLIAQPEICGEYNLYYDLYILESGEHSLQRLTHCGRYRSASWLDENSVIAVHIGQSVSSLHKISLQNGDKEMIWQGDSTTIIGQPDISPDGTRLAAPVFRNNHGWNIEIYDLENHTWKKLTDDPAIDMYPRFAVDGSALLFSSERNNVYNIYRYDFSSHTISALTHEMSGAFQPAQKDSFSDLYYTGYSTAGSDIYQLKAPRTLTTEILQPVLDKQPDLVLSGYPVIQARDYSPWSSLEPRWWEPLLLLAEDQSEIGFATSGNDALGLHNYAFSFAWDTVNEYATSSAVYAWSNRLYIGAQRSSDILLDANGDFAIARQDDDVFFIASFPCTQIDSSWNISLAALSRHSRDARREPWIMPLPDDHDGLAGLAVGFNNSDHYIRSVSVNNGRNVHFIAESSEIFSSDFSGEVYTFDWREYLSMGGQHVLALRLLAGYGTGQPDPFQLGGENTDFEMLDMLDEFSNIRFGKREYALRGYAEGHSELSGRRMQLGTMEWRFPLSLIERGYMAPPVALMQLSGSVFAERGMAWQDSAGEGYSSAGTELHGDINLFYGITVKLRLGFARGLDERLGDSRIYLSLGSAF